MTATVQTKKNRPNYYIVMRYQDESTNKERQKWITTDIPVKGDNKRRAEQRRKEILAEYEVEKIDLSKDVLFTVFIKEWLEFLKPSIELVTYDGYKLIIYNQIIPFFEPKKLKVRDLTPLHIQEYVNTKLKKVSPNTVRKHLWNLSKCLDSAVKQKLIAFNPVKAVDMPKPVKFNGAKFYSEKQIDELLSVIKGDPIEGIVMFAIFYGLRRSEVCGLKWDAINFDNKTFDIKHTAVQMGTKIYKKDSTKNAASNSSLPMPDIIVDMLKKLKAERAKNKLLQPNDYIDEGYVFVHADGRLITPNYVTNHFKRVLKWNNLPAIRFHDLRHSSASYLLYLGFNMKEIQMWLRHGDIGTTMNIYAHLDMSAKRNIADTLNEKFAAFG